MDVTGDGKADIIGFGNDAGPWVALSNGDGTFQPAKIVQVTSPSYAGPAAQRISVDSRRRPGTNGGLKECSQYI